MSDVASTRKLNLSIDYRYICAALLLVVIGMLLAWRPWVASPASNARTIKVTGDAEVKAEPDEFVFSPAYEAKNTDKAAALEEINIKTEEVTAGLKKLGVAANKIKTNTSGYENFNYYGQQPDGQTYSVYFTVTVSNLKNAQKIQDYLVSTAPTGSVSPNPTFSKAKQKELESKARDAATKEARSKAEQSARNLGFKIGAVKSVEDGSGFDTIQPYAAMDTNISSVASSKLAVQPGENNLTYSVTVTYYLR